MATTVITDVRRLLRLLVLTASFVAITAFYIWTGATSGEPAQPAPELGGYYNMLARGYLAGHLYLPTAPDPRLLALPDPYDAIANQDFRLHDAALFRDHYYLYYGPTPALALFVPYRLATGKDLPQPMAIAIFGTCGLLFAWLILYRIGIAILGRPPSIPLALASLFALGFSSAIPFILRRPSHYEVAIAAGYAFVFASLWMFTIGAIATRPRITILAIASVLLGLAGGARFPMLGAGAVIPAIAAYWLSGNRLKSIRDRVGLVLALVVPCAICVVLLGWYNYARFGSWTEFGIQYTLQGVNSKSYDMFHLRRLGYGLAYYLVVPPVWTRYFPFFRLDPAAILPRPEYLLLEPVAGILATTPMLLIIPTVLWRRTRHLSALLAIVASLAIGTLLLLVFAASGMTMRYEVDFATFFLLAAVWIWYEWIRAAGTRGGLPRAVTTTLFVGLATAGTLCQLCLSFTGYYDTLNRFHGDTFEALIRWSRPIERVLGGAPVRILGIESAHRIERTGTETLLWLNARRVRIQIRSDRARTVALTATLIPGPSADSALSGRHLRIRLNASPDAEERLLPAGPIRIPLAVDAGVTVVTLEATDPVVNKVLPNGDTRVLLVGLNGLQVAPFEVEPVVQEVTATSRFQDLDEYDAKRAFDGDDRTCWAVNGDRSARLMTHFNRTGTVKGLVLLARETSRIEAWQSVQADLYLKGKREGSVRVTLPTAATNPRQTIDLPPTLVDSIELSFDQPIRTLPNGTPVSASGNPGYAEIGFVWKH